MMSFWSFWIQFNKWLQSLNVMPLLIGQIYWLVVSTGLQEEEEEVFAQLIRHFVSSKIKNDLSKQLIKIDNSYRKGPFKWLLRCDFDHENY